MINKFKILLNKIQMIGKMILSHIKGIKNKSKKIKRNPPNNKWMKKFDIKKESTTKCQNLL